MSKSGQAFIAKTQGTKFTLYAAMKKLGIPLSKKQEKCQAHLERKYPSYIQGCKNEDDWREDR